MSRRESPRLGELLVSAGHVRREDVFRALYYQRKMAELGRSVQLGEILVVLGLIDPARVNESEKILETVRLDKAALCRQLRVLAEMAERSRIEEEALFKELGLDSDRIQLARLRGAWRDGLAEDPSARDEAEHQRSVLVTEFGPERAREALAVAEEHGLRFSALKRILRYQDELRRLGVEDSVASIAADQGLIQRDASPARERNLRVAPPPIGPLGWAFRAGVPAAAVGLFVLAGARAFGLLPGSPAPEPSPERTTEASHVVVGSGTRPSTASARNAPLTMDDRRWREVPVDAGVEKERRLAAFQSLPVPEPANEASPLPFVRPGLSGVPRVDPVQPIARTRRTGSTDPSPFEDPDLLSVEALPLSGVPGIRVQGRAARADGTVLDVEVRYAGRVLEGHRVRVERGAFETGFLFPTRGPETLCGIYAVEVWYRARRQSAGMGDWLPMVGPLVARDQVALGTPERFLVEDAALRGDLVTIARGLDDARDRLLAEIARRLELEGSRRVADWSAFADSATSELHLARSRLATHRSRVYAPRYPETLDLLCEVTERLGRVNALAPALLAGTEPRGTLAILEANLARLEQSLAEWLDADPLVTAPR